MRISLRAYGARRREVELYPEGALPARGRNIAAIGEAVGACQSRPVEIAVAPLYQASGISHESGTGHWLCLETMGSPE